jgi:glycosyltransferase involved in cell wall biosynthesis
MIKVLHLWKSDSPKFGGGGAGSMYRLHSNLIKAGIESKILCENKATDSSHVAVIPRRMRRTEFGIRYVTMRLGLNDIYRLNSSKIKGHEFYSEADILNFHGIHSGFINYLTLPSLTEHKLSVFTLRDMWCMTGHCAVNYDCDRWKTGCGNCPYPEAYPPIKRDATHIEWKLKNWIYKRSKLCIVTVSKLQTEQAKVSMLQRFPIYHIPNGVDTELYQPVDPDLSRFALGIPKKSKVLMFVATNLGLPGKGGDLLIKALKNLPKTLKKEMLLLLLGSGGDTIGKMAGIKSLNLGYITNERIKLLAYSSADLFILPTRSEGLSLVLLESMSCGTPMLSFRVGGNPDLVRDGITGYLAEPENVKELSFNIIKLLEDESLRNKMAQNCRQIAQGEFSTDIETKRYIELYSKLLSDQVYPA